MRMFSECGCETMSAVLRLLKFLHLSLISHPYSLARSHHGPLLAGRCGGAPARARRARAAGRGRGGCGAEHRRGRASLQAAHGPGALRIDMQCLGHGQQPLVPSLLWSPGNSIGRWQMPLLCRALQAILCQRTCKHYCGGSEPSSQLHFGKVLTLCVLLQNNLNALCRRGAGSCPRAAWQRTLQVITSAACSRRPCALSSRPPRRATARRVPLHRSALRLCAGCHMRAGTLAPPRSWKLF